VSLEDLRAFGSTDLARHVLLLRLHLLDELPRNPTGKVLKAELRASLA
jgi:fatty-acyl-CoA synthase